MQVLENKFLSGPASEKPKTRSNWVFVADSGSQRRHYRVTAQRPPIGSSQER